MAIKPHKKKNFGKRRISEEDLQEDKDLLQLQVEELANEIKTPAPIPKEVDEVITILNALPQDKPQAATIAGSHKVGSASSRTPAVDVLVTLPKGYISLGEIRKHAYLTKRNEYVRAVQQHLHQEQYRTLIKTAFERDLAGDDSKKMVAVTLRNSPCEVHVHFTCDMQKETNAVVSHFKDLSKQKSYEARYSQLVLEDVLMQQHLALVEASLRDSATLSETCILLKLWSSQRQFQGYNDSLNNHLMTVLVCYLISAGVLNPMMPAYQMFRLVVNYLATKDFVTAGLAFPSNQGGSTSGMSADDIKNMHRHYPVVLMDPTHAFNFFFRIAADAWVEIKREAERTMEGLGQSGSNPSLYHGMQSFKVALIHSIPFWRKFDMHIVISDAHAIALKDAPQNHSPEEGRLTLRMRIQKEVDVLLKRAFGARVVDYRSCWNMAGPNTLVIGLRLASWEVSLSVVTKGPEIAEEEESAEFCAFWKSRSARRRFKDGTIVNTVLWDAGEKQYILRDIARYILGEYLQVPESDVQQPGAALTELITIPGRGNQPRCDLMEMAIPQITKAFSTLQNYLQNMDPHRLPLTVTDVWAADPVLRRTAPAPPLKNLLLTEAEDEEDPRLYCKYRCVKPIVVVVQFQSSQAWPYDLEAIAHLKTALYIHIAKRMVNERELICTPRADGCDISLDGFVFRVLIRHPKEMGLLLRRGKNRSARLLERSLVHLPQHHQFIKQVASSCTSYAEAVRLALLWASNHMLTPHLSTECIELIMAYVYIQPLPYTTPNSHYIALQRFWTVLYTFDWELHPLVVRFPDDDDIDVAAMKAYAAEARAGVVSVMWIATRYCESWSPMTHTGPDKTILKRAQLFAKQSDTIFSQMMAKNTTSGEEWEKLFTTSLRPYHILVDLKPDIHPYTPYKGKATRARGAESLHWFVDYDIVAYFKEMLTGLFAEHCQFFYNPVSGLTIGVLATSDDAKGNLELLAEKIAEAGQGLVQEIKIQGTSLPPKTAAAAPQKSQAQGKSQGPKGQAPKGQAPKGQAPKAEGQSPKGRVAEDSTEKKKKGEQAGAKRKAERTADTNTEAKAPPKKKAKKGKH